MEKKDIASSGFGAVELPLTTEYPTYPKISGEILIEI
jgi:hypothetical protein